ncbi:MAG: nucleotidyltransferase domain-containing protein [Bacteroidales bacterium]|nr:nucleotidyltransferase domain-containing protein [Bacteroidales bacterium]
MNILEMQKVNEIVNTFTQVCQDCFLTGSYRFNRASKDSDIDIAFPIMAKAPLIEYLAKINVTELEHSHYNAGVKFHLATVDQTINAVFLHPLDFVCWYIAANMLNASNVPLNNMARHDFHALHQIMISLPKMMIRDCVTSTNYKEFMSDMKNGQKI